MKLVKTITQKLTILLAIAIVTRGAFSISPSPTFTFEFIDKAGSMSNHLKVCRDNTSANIVIGWINTGLPIAFNTQGSITANQFISNTGGAKQYTLIERGSDACHMPDPGYTGWVLLGLVIEPHPTLPDTCSVTRVITTRHLTACTGGLENLEDFFQVSLGTYDHVGKKSSFSFDKTKTPRSYGQFTIMKISLPFSYADITEEFFEFLILKPKLNFDNNWNTVFRKTDLALMRRAYMEIDGNLFTAKKFVQRNLWGGLRGHILIPDAAADPFGAYKNTITYKGFPNMSQTLILHFFVSKPLEMTQNDVLQISIETRPTKLGDADHTLKPFSYKVRVVRKTSNDEFLLYLVRYEGGVSKQQVILTVFFSPTNTDWLHFGVSLGYGVLYFIDDQNARFRRTDAIHAWVSGSDFHNEMTFDEDQPISSIITPTGFPQTSFAFLTVSLRAFTGPGGVLEINENKFGLRLWQRELTYGSALGYKFANTPMVDNRCFLKKAFLERCNLYAFMRNEGDTNTMSLLNDQIRNRAKTCSLSECGYCLRTRQCVNTKGGRNEDLFYDFYTFSENDYEGTRYNPLNPSHAQEFKKVVNNLGKEYWIRCPVDCKSN